MRRTHLIPAAALLALTLGLVGCASAASNPGDAAAPDASGESWPRTIDIPAGAHTAASTITIDEAPQRIATLDYESTEVIAEIGLAEYLVLIPEAVLNPMLGSHVDELEDVAATFPVAMEVEAETVLSLAPDLVVMSPRHGNEAPIAAVLEQAGVPVLLLPDSWASSDTLLTNIALIGQATGGEDAAATLAATIENGLADASVDTAGAAGPRVLVLTNQAGRPFITAGDAYPLELLALAGATNAADELGIERTGPITAEQLVHSAPDGVVLIDMNGTGDRMFAELLSNPAVASMPAFKDDRILRIEGKRVQALGLTNTVDGLADLAEWVGRL